MMKIKNRYADRYPQYAETPKAVIAAVACSLAMRLCQDNDIEAKQLLRNEWDILTANGIVPQVRPKPHKDRSW